MNTAHAFSLTITQRVSTVSSRHTFPTSASALCWQDELLRGDGAGLLSSLLPWWAQAATLSSRTISDGRSPFTLLSNISEHKGLLHSLVAGLVTAVVEHPYCPPWVWEKTLADERWALRLHQGGPRGWKSSPFSTLKGKQKEEGAGWSSWERDRHEVFSLLSLMADKLVEIKTSACGTKYDNTRSNEEWNRDEKEFAELLVLAALCVAPNDSVAISLARSSSTVSSTRTGCTLIAYCYLYRRRLTDGSINKMESSPSKSTENHWKTLWSLLNLESPSLVDRVAGVAEHSFLLSWKVHCALGMGSSEEGETGEVARVLEAGLSRYHVGSSLKRGMYLYKDSLELLRSMPLHAQMEWIVGIPTDALRTSRLAFAVKSELCNTVLNTMKKTFNEPKRFTPLGMLTAPYSTAIQPTRCTSKLFSALLQHILFTGHTLASKEKQCFLQTIERLTTLCAAHNPHALMISMVPDYENSVEAENLMRAQCCPHRVSLMHSLAEELLAALEWLCSGSSNNTWVSMRVDPWSAAAGMGKEGLKLHSHVYHRVPFTWRCEKQKSVDLAVDSVSQVLIDALKLCSNRKLVHRKPSASTAILQREVRSHKCEWLLSELPHEIIASFLRQLLKYGYMKQGVSLIQCLVNQQQLDLRAYPSFLISTMYMAVRSTRAEKKASNDHMIVEENALPELSHTAHRLSELYTQRLLVFGEDEKETVQKNKKLKLITHSVATDIESNSDSAFGSGDALWASIYSSSAGWTASSNNLSGVSTGSCNKLYRSRNSDAQPALRHRLV